ncbi:unnamed protein product [Scytosiphon promiscuus]
MASSLRRQVDSLRHASSGTSSGYIQRKKGKPSLLLTPDQARPRFETSAAEVDLSSVRETAVMGLQRLEAVNQDFSPFQLTLFSKEAEGTLRDLQTKEANERIDKSVEAFLALLSPHFCSREAHFCLEYLIRHYKVYQYNVDAVVECCLPWHDTLAFARMVQLLSLKGSRWEFLTPVQKTGSPLPREAIARRCARDFGLLRFLCVSARRSAGRSSGPSAADSSSSSSPSVSAATAAGRAKLFSFYAAVVVEALASLGSASEALLRALVPTVVHGLSATKSPEYQMASYMILSALSAKGPLSAEVTGAALTALVCKPCQGGLEPSLLCALAVAQTQVGFSSKAESSGTAAGAGSPPLLLPAPAFEKLSDMGSLASVLSGLAKKFDATAFLWLLLQSYVQHLPDADRGQAHAQSLTRLCTYPYWPSHSLPRLVRRLVDRLIRSYLAVTLEGARTDEMEVEDEEQKEKSRRSASMKTESQRVLRVLGLRFPQEVDAAVAKISRSVSKAKTAAARADDATLQESDSDNDDTAAGRAEAAKREAMLKEEALSSLLVSTFAGAELAQRLPLEQLQDGEDTETLDDDAASSGTVHGSIMVALEHSSGVVRARAVEQLSRVMADAAEGQDDEVAQSMASASSPTVAGRTEDLSPALLRRLYDEDPEVVLAIAGSDALVNQVLLGRSSGSSVGDGHEGQDVVEVSDDVSLKKRAAMVASSAAAAASPWLAALSEARPKHPVASTGRVLCGLLRLASTAATAAAAAGGDGDAEEGSAAARQAGDCALSLCLECLPGPHAVARVKQAQRQTSTPADGRSCGATEDESAAVAAVAAAGKACKKALRGVGRAAIKAVGGSAAGGGVVGLFAGLETVLEQEPEGKGKGKRASISSAKSPIKRRSKATDAEAVEADEGGKSKGLKAMGDEVCDVLAAAFVAAATEEAMETKRLQALAETSGSGGRWLILESLSRGVSIAAAGSDSGAPRAKAAAKAAVSTLASLLAAVAMYELRRRPEAFSPSADREHGGDGTVEVGGADLLRYLRACAAHLPRPDHPSSLHAEDHLTTAAPAVVSSRQDETVVTPDPILGDVLVSILEATAAAAATAAPDGGSGAGAAWRAVSAVVLHGYERRPLSALAAIAIHGASSVMAAAGAGGQGRRKARRQRSVVDAGKAVAAARALCVAATFVRAAAEAAAAGDIAGDERSTAEAEGDVVAVFPAAVVAAASCDKGLRDSGLLLISTVAAHGSSLLSSGSGDNAPNNKRAKKSISAASTAPSTVVDSEVFPSPPSGGQDRKDTATVDPTPLQAPPLHSIVRLAKTLAEKDRESPLDARELTRHLASSLGAGEEAAGSPGDGEAVVARYLVAWAARLGWRDQLASAGLLECLVWAKTPMRECCLPLLRHCLDMEHRARGDAANDRLLKLLLDVTLSSPASAASGVQPDEAGQVDQEDGAPKSAKKGSAKKTPTTTARGGKGRGDKQSVGSSRGGSGSPVAAVSASSVPTAIFPSAEAEELMHRALRIPGQAQALALQSLASFSSATKVSEATPSAGDGSSAASEAGDGGGIAAKIENEPTRQRRALILALVEAGLAGADGSLVAAAARALPALPSDLASLLGGLAPVAVSTGDTATTPSKSRKKQRAEEARQRSDDTESPTNAWVSTLGGLAELAQSLCGSSSADQPLLRTLKGARDVGGPATSSGSASAEGWSWAAPLRLARPLFDALPALAAVGKTQATTSATVAVDASSLTAEASAASADVIDAAEYTLWLTMDVLGAVLRRWGKGSGTAAAARLYDASRAGEDAEMVLTCIRENPSPQTRNSGLALLSRMATLFPAQMATRLRSLLDAVCAAAAGSEGLSGGGVVGGGARTALRQTQKAVQSVVPALKAHGAEAGVGAHFVVQVFVEALDDAPVHARRALFSTLIASLGEESLVIMSALLLKQAVSPSLAGVGGDEGVVAEEEEATSALVEFVHQTVHCSAAHSQVKTLVGLVQSCHRLSVNAAERSGDLSGQAREDAVECFVEDGYPETDYMQLPLEQQRAAPPAGSGGGPVSRKPAASFMTVDLRALLPEVSAADTTAANEQRMDDDDDDDDSVRAHRIVLRSFLEETLAFVRDHLVSRPLLMAVAAAAERGADARGQSEEEGIQEGFLLLCEELLLLLRTLSACDRSSSGAGGGCGPSWSTLQGLAYAVFETLQSLLSVPSFVAVTQELLQHQDPHLRRKALQMFTRRLDPEGGAALRLSPGEEGLFVEMVPSLRLVAMGKNSSAVGADSDDDGDAAADARLEEVMGPSSSETDAMDQDGENVEGTGMEESAVNRQTALLSLDVLARVLGRRHQAAFVGVLDDVTDIVAGVGPGALPAVGESGADGILPLRASAFLLLATLCAVLGVRAFPHLPRFFPAMLRALESQASAVAAQTGRGGGQSLLWTSALSAVATVAASLPSFLSPYLKRILAVALRPAAVSAITSSGGGVSAASAGSKQAADRVLSLLAAGVEPRLLVPAVCGAYAVCVEGGEDEDGLLSAAGSVARLLAYVQEIVASLEKEAASAALPQFTRLLTQALDFRRQHAGGSAPQVRASADLVEKEASSALVSLVMRLSEVELRPLFVHLCEWKGGVSEAGDDDDKEIATKAKLGVLDRRLSFYRVLEGLAGALKSIFTPYFAHVLTDCCDDLEAAAGLLGTEKAADGGAKKRKRSDKKAKSKAVNARKRRKTLTSSGDPSGSDEDDDVNDDGDGDGAGTPEYRWRRSAASRLVLSALRRCFQSDRSGFVTKARFDLLLPAVVTQLDCGADFSALEGSGGGEGASDGANEVSSCRLHAEELVGPCLAQLASASGKDALWKAMANAVLMKTRSRRAGVRVAALVSLRQCFEVVGEEFLALLPECLPFLSELLEDGHPEVEGECRALVKYIEGILGESIESYLV